MGDGKHDDRLVWIGTRDGAHVVVVGSPAWLWQSLTLSALVPRWGSLFNGWDLTVSRVLGYLVSMSGALGVMNALPIHALDGSHLLDILLEGHPYWDDVSLYWIKSVCTAVLSANVLLSLVKATR